MGLETASLITAFYDADGEQIGHETIWSDTDYDQQTFVWQQGGFTTPLNTASIRVGFAASLDNDVENGWLMADQITLRSLGEMMPILVGQPYIITTELYGEVDSAAGIVGGRLAARFYHAQGDLLADSPIWESGSYDAPDNLVQQTGSVSHPEAVQMRLVTSVVLDDGWLNFDHTRLQTMSEPLTVSGGESYRLTTALSGQLAAAGAGRLALIIDGDTENPAFVWENPANFDEDDLPVIATFTTPTGAMDVQLRAELPVDGGWLTVSGITLELFDPANQTTRKTYSLAGQAIAVRVSGDPEAGNNGLFYIHSDHLGSTSVMSDESGAQVGPTTRYTPFGDYRTGGQSEITDRGYTGHRENRGIGLTYMNARYYLPGTGRFLSADTIVPDPANPQSFNRYSYVNNSPTTHT